jgi:hypothetical protein
MAEPRILLATLCLNEMEHLQRLYQQHKDWPGMVRWCFVEAADRAYANANPEMVSKDFLSVDGTTEFLEALAKADSRVVHVKHGLTCSADISQGKAEARNRYCEVANEERPEYVVQLDADEFYTFEHQRQLNRLLQIAPPAALGMLFRQREIWRPPSIAHLPLMSFEVLGGLWKMTHCHCWRWCRGMRYRTTHIWPETGQGRMMNELMVRYDASNYPQYIHLGWASSEKTRQAKIAYYFARGEGAGDGRNKWMECRQAWAEWEPGEELPHGAYVIPYVGPVPEVLRG